jgi:hypothetical protein
MFCPTSARSTSYKHRDRAVLISSHNVVPLQQPTAYFDLAVFQCVTHTYCVVLLHSPNVVPLAVRLAVSHKAGARLVQELVALRTLEAGCVPLQIWRHSQNVLVVDLSPTTHTQTQPPLLCKTQCSLSPPATP